MEGMEKFKGLISSFTHNGIKVEQFVEPSQWDNTSTADGFGQPLVIIQTVTDTRPKFEYPKYVTEVKEEKPKPIKKLHKLSEIDSQMQRIFRQQFSERQSILKDYSMTFEQFCKDNYDVDINE